MLLMAKHPVLAGFPPDPVIDKLPISVRVYEVGGAVRDALLGVPSIDKDWVVVGATVNDMLQADFTPVGADFPVFLHPVSKEEYALARTERKSGHGYKGFAFHADPAVTLEEDLARRDFTVNAMAANAKGDLLDPYGGLADLQAKVMRHVSPAFVEDPLRVLRLARFLARFVDFTVAEETLDLCQALHESGELKHLVAERIFAELNKGMREEKPSRMIKLINKLDAWADLSRTCQQPFSGFGKPEFDQLNSLKSAEDRWIYALGFFMDAQQIKGLAKIWRLPKELEDLSVLASNCLQFLQQSEFTSVEFGQFFSRVDLYRKPARLARVSELVHRVLGQARVNDFVQVAVGKIEQGDYKAFLGDKISHMPAGKQVAQIAASARQAWIDSLYSEHF